jgi:hypothetical protein
MFRVVCVSEDKIKEREREREKFEKDRLDCARVTSLDGATCATWSN